MKILEGQKLEILYDHYKCSFGHIRTYLRQRETLFILLLIIIFLQFIEISFAEKTTEAVNHFIEGKINYDFEFSKQLLNILLWFLFFMITLKYFQANILINKNYNYIHKLEDTLCKLAKDKNFINREGNSYLKQYKHFSTFTYIIYNWVLPLILLGTAVMQIVSDLSRSINGILSGIFFLCILLTILFYLYAMYEKDSKK